MALEFSDRVTVDGKYFALRGNRFDFRGVTYGTFAAREDGELFPERSRIKHDFHMMAECGITVVRTYTDPPDDVCDLAADWGIKLLSGVFYPDWRYLTGMSRGQRAGMIREARRIVAKAARRHAGNENILGLVIGNEVPADVVRWFGAKEVARVISDLVEVVREEDPEQLVSYANYPTAEYLELSDLDFLTFNVFLEDGHDFRKYLARLHHMAGDRPLVMGELGLDAARGEDNQARLIAEQLRIAMERGVAGACVFSWTDEWAVGGRPVEGWHFGLTNADRTPRPALEEVAAFNRRSLVDLREQWPSISVVVCAYNAASTLDECLEHVCALDYPDLEVIVVDDGSTDATPAIARRHPVKLLQEGWGGLSAARNLGCAVASGEIVAYLDADAYPSPEWPYLLALGFDSPMVAGVGGPNLPPPGSTDKAQQVARAPGGPVHVMLTDDRAEHIPGCNMAFWKKAVIEVGAFDPAYVAAGDDVDLCWKLIDRDWEIAFHPSAVVWHHPRGSAKGYLKQQMGYGKAEALVAARHPNRFTGLGMARWRGLIYNSLGATAFMQKIYRGTYGAGEYQSVYRADSHGIQIAHQLGIPLAVAAMAMAPLGLLHPAFAIIAGAAALFIAGLGAVDTMLARPPRRTRSGSLRFRLAVAVLSVLQPVARTWGRIRDSAAAQRAIKPAPIPSPAQTVEGDILIFPNSLPREQFVDALAANLRRAGVRMETPTGWEDHDLSVIGSSVVTGQITTSAYPEGCIQMRVKRQVRWKPLAGFAMVGAAAAAQSNMVAVLVAGGLGIEALRGLNRIPTVIHEVIKRGS